MDEFDAWIALFLLIMFALLLFCVCWLVSKLRKSRDLAVEQGVSKSVYDREIRTLYVILGVFNATYLIRAVWNYYLAVYAGPTNFWWLILALTNSLLWDFIPCMMMMMFHYRNFKGGDMRSQVSQKALQ